MRALAVLFTGLLLAGCGQEKVAEAQKDPAKETFAAIEAVALPTLQRDGDTKAYQEEYERAWEARAPLVLKAFREFPDDERTARIMDQFWQSRMNVGMSKEECDKVLADIESARGSTTNPQLRQHAAFWTGFYSSYRDREDVAKVMQHADLFSRSFPNDPRGATLFSFASMAEGATNEQLLQAFGAMAGRYETTEEGQFARIMIPMMENLGQPFDFAFKDAVTGKGYSDESFRGKVLVVDWWATWCAPCVASLPKMLATYEKYKDKGVAFIGVSLDQPENQGGLKALKEFVAKNKVPWPQYFLDGKSEFANKYMVANIPAVFVVGRDGKVVSVDGVRSLERTLEKLTT